ncbi:hypothetical protein [Clostridium sp. Marseille-P3244]|uniref:hypothetical protein n=1 Tax=Clostridium sp. Marseille-P3244 TaxID=1871020 RepID=UPI00092FE237|nr:hypothetical protein [Clostridium sp. Marseille-P3244]
MKTYTALIWIVLAVAMLCYLIWRNIRLTKVLRNVMDLTSQSRTKCDGLIAKMQSCRDQKERVYIMQQLLDEEKGQRELFADEKKWPGQRKRIREHLQSLREYIVAADEISRNMYQ